MPKQDTWMASGRRLAMSRRRSVTPTVMTIRTLDRSRSLKSGWLTTGSQIVSKAASTIVQRIETIWPRWRSRAARDHRGGRSAAGRGIREGQTGVVLLLQTRQRLGQHGREVRAPGE